MNEVEKRNHREGLAQLGKTIEELRTGKRQFLGVSYQRAVVNEPPDKEGFPRFSPAKDFYMTIQMTDLIQQPKKKKGTEE